MSIIPTEAIPYLATFLFVFAMVFGLLTYSRIFTQKEEKPNRRINGALALAIAFFSLLYQPLVSALTLYMPIAIAILIPIFFLVFLKKVFESKKEGQKEDTLPLLVALAIMFLLLYVFEDRVRSIIPIGIDTTNFLWVIGIVGVILFFWLIYKTPSKAPE